MIRVLCVDDNFLVLESILVMLRHEPDIEVVGQLFNADALVETVAKLGPHVIVLDLDMPGRPAFEALRELTTLYPESRTLIYSGIIRPESMQTAIDAGAWGYLLKPGAPRALVDGIRRIAAGDVVLEDVAPMNRRPSTPPAGEHAQEMRDA